MKITELRTRTVWVSRERSWLIIEVHTDGGLVGLGEASQSRNDAGVIEEIARLGSQYVHRDPLDLIARSQVLLEWPYIGRTMFAAVSGIEQALWDLCGKHLGVPVYQLLGGRTADRIRTYANIGYAAAGGDAESLARTAQGAVADGFDALKFYPFGMRPRDGTTAGEERRWIANGLANVRAVREVVGDDVDILLDLMHQFGDFKQVRDIARQLDAFKLFWIEDPLVHDDPAQLAELRQSLGARLAGGAPILTPREWRPLLEGRAFDVIMPDVKWLGGIDQLRKVAAMADAFGATVSPHNASGPIATAASLHASLTLANFVMLEVAWGVPNWRGALCCGTETIINGYFTPPTAPGLGVDLDGVVAAQHRDRPDVDGSIPGIRLPLN